MKATLLFIFMVMVLVLGSVSKDFKPDQRLLTQIAEQTDYLINHTKDDHLIVRSFENGKYNMVKKSDWTSGHTAGNYWFTYELTGDEKFKRAAVDNTLKLEGVQNMTDTHDIGFMIFCSYGNAYRITKDEAYKTVVLKAAESLSTRYNPKVGCIRSWSWGKWQYPVIIDNMMNLEMLFWASRVSGNPKYKEIAIQHALTTLKNHYRSDMSSYHVVDYDSITGKPVKKQTWQGMNDESSWSRGQAWGLYGYVVCYRETGDKRFLEAAQKIYKYIAANLPTDKVAYWDFKAPVTPETVRDASAASLTAAALYILSPLDKGNRKEYISLADQIMTSLSSPEYLNKNGEKGGFLLKHFTGGKTLNLEVDASINYADYYYLEALKYKMKK